MRSDTRTKRIALEAILFSLALVLQSIENMIPTPFHLAPGIKLGLSNIVTMFVLSACGYRDALILAVMKGIFAFITRGPVAGILSACGGVGSVSVMKLSERSDCSEGMVSVFGAVSHNIFQLLMDCVLLKSTVALYYAPVLMISGVLMGIITAYILRLLDPVLKKFWNNLGE